MRRIHRLALLGVLLVTGPVLAGCENFDMDKLDVFGLNEKKKLPGERKELFPSGVPGVTQGVPPEYMKGYQPPPESASADAALPPASKVNPGDEDASAALKPAAKTAAVDTADTAKPKPKRKPKPVAAQRPPTQVTIQPAAPGQLVTSPPQQSPWPESNQQPQQAQSPWPDANQQGASSPWPAGTTSR